MSETTLLVELEKDKKKIVEKKLDQVRQKTENKKDLPKKDKKLFNAFSSKSFKNSSPSVQVEKSLEPEIKKSEETVVQEEVKTESKVSSTIETPNYDLMETLTDEQREKVFKIEKEENVKPKAKPSKLKAIILSIIFGIFGVWGIINIAQIDSIGTQISEVAYKYEMNLPKYLSKLTNLDATNSENMENLFQTIPDEDVSPSKILEKSNWFDRFCNFIAGLFGG